MFVKNPSVFYESFKFVIMLAYPTKKGPAEADPFPESVLICLICFNLFNLFKSILICFGAASLT